MKTGVPAIQHSTGRLKKIIAIIIIINIVINEQKEPVEPWETQWLFEQADFCPSLPVSSMCIYFFI